jgi:hypothetical protein
VFHILSVIYVRLGDTQIKEELDQCECGKAMQQEIASLFLAFVAIIREEVLQNHNLYVRSVLSCCIPPHKVADCSKCDL